MALKNQREQLMHTMIGQLTIIAMVGIITWIYILPDYTILAKSAIETSLAIETFNSTSKNGIAYPELSAMLQGTK
jgi:hypothetical protein